MPQSELERLRKIHLQRQLSQELPTDGNPFKMVNLDVERCANGVSNIVMMKQAIIAEQTRSVESLRAENGLTQDN